MGKRVAVSTKGYGGLEDFVSEVFGRAKTFTLVEVENGQVRGVQVVDNPAASYDYGCGPVVVKMLADFKVDLVLAAELGPGVLRLLERYRIKSVLVKPNMKVVDAIKEFLSKIGG
ncbi:MAG: NifB/NifX family molybdenum-iron cluster-binding protein [Candidatus Bathyarchaeota archaeon]